MPENINISEIEQHVIDFVVKLRHDKKLSQQDIATVLDVDRSFVTNIESGTKRAKYNLNHINLLADHFGLSPREFLPEKPMV